jgi:hypothetical protein
MNGNCWKVESTHSSRILLLLFCLLASISLTPSEFIDCQKLFPDENLDFFGISNVSQKQSPVSRVSTFVLSSSTPKYSLNSHLLLAIFFCPSINSHIVLATILRC